MIRAFLTKIGEEYLGHSFNTGSGKGKEIWTRIKEKAFDKNDEEDIPIKTSNRKW